ncbi:MAG: hypothetical protein RL204_141 [Bacteroidota bacterium]
MRFVKDDRGLAIWSAAYFNDLIERKKDSQVSLGYFYVLQKSKSLFSSSILK